MHISPLFEPETNSTLFEYAALTMTLVHPLKAGLPLGGTQEGGSKFVTICSWCTQTYSEKKLEIAKRVEKDYMYNIIEETPLAWKEDTFNPNQYSPGKKEKRRLYSHLI